ncbi:MAG: HemK/PrmC family methyltransferase [Trueperaceae bacterium]|nr:HemK/PrmC family methyltransferase [Trueperaceae bacterium]
MTAFHGLEARLRRAGVAAPAAEAWAMLTHLAGRDRLDLLTGTPWHPSPAQNATLQAWVRRRAEGHPLQHLLGVAPFHGVDLQAGPEALVPRPETEVLVERVLEGIRTVPTPVVLDLGTGSGAVAIALARARPDAEIWASDVAEEALALASRNALAHAPAVRLVRADLFDAPALQALLPRLDALAANLPYLPASDAAGFSREVRHDPPHALLGGPDGLEPFRRAWQGAVTRLPSRARAWFELDPRNVHAAAAEVEAGPGGWRTRVHDDLAGRARVLEAWRGVG